MPLFSNALNSVRSLAGEFGLTSAAPVIPATAQEETGPVMTPEAQALFNVKRDILAQVRADMPEGDRPTLEQYRLAAEKYAETEQGKAMVERGEWNAKIAADLSGQDLSNFTITEPKKAAAMQHYLDVQEEKPEKAESKIESSIDMYDRDGDGKINVAASDPFYDNIRFDKADLHGAWVEPATSFNEEIAKAGNLESLTFNGMKEGDTFTFGAGVYKDARMTNINDGEVVFADHSHVDGISIEGVRAKVSIGDHATVDNIEVSDQFRIISLEMGRNSVISNSDLSQSTVSMTSHFEPGATFQNVNLSGNLDGLDFSGLRLNNVTIDGKPVIKTAQLEEYGITYDASTIATASADLTKQYDLAQIRATMQGAVASIGTSSQPAAQETPAPEIAAAAAPTVSNSPAASQPAADTNREDTSLSSLAQIRATMQGAIATIGTPSAPAEAAANTKETLTTQLAASDANNTEANLVRAQEVTNVSQANNGNDPLAAARAAMLASGVMGGASVTTTDVTLTTQVASLERTVPVQDQATAANMQRDVASSQDS